MQQKHGVVVGVSYPSRIVVHEDVSKANMARMAAAYDGNKGLAKGALVPPALTAAPGAAGVGATQMASDPAAHTAAAAALAGAGHYPYGGGVGTPIAELSGTVALPASSTAGAGSSSGSSGGSGKAGSIAASFAKAASAAAPKGSSSSSSSSASKGVGGGASEAIDLTGDSSSDDGDGAVAAKPPAAKRAKGAAPAAPKQSKLTDVYGKR